MLKEFGISEELINLSQEVEKEISEEFSKIDKRTLDKSIKVLKAFQDNRIADVHFNTTTGYRI